MSVLEIILLTILCIFLLPISLEILAAVTLILLGLLALLVLIPFLPLKMLIKAIKQKGAD
jgi:hypothetical protein